MNTPLKQVEHIDQIFRSQTIFIEDREFLYIDLILLDMSDSDVIIRMNLLTPNQAKINCQMTMKRTMPRCPSIEDQINLLT